MKNRVFAALSVASIASLCAVASETKVFEWVNGTDRTAKLLAAGNWNGAAPVKHNAVGNKDQTNAVFSFNRPLDFHQWVYLENSDGAYASPNDSLSNVMCLGTIEGNHPGYLLSAVPGFNSRFTAVKDASSFEGSLSSFRDLTSNEGVVAGGTWILLSTPENPARVKNVFSEHGLGIAVHGENSVGIVDNLWGVGTWRAPFKWVRKNTTLEIKESHSGVGSDLVLSGDTTLLVHGKDYSRPGIAGDPWLHLDATCESTMTVESGRITEWKDVRGNGVAAIAYDGNPGPVVMADESSALSFVNFGAMANEAHHLEKYGPSSTLRFNGGKKTGIKEVFVVFKDQPIKQPSPADDKIVQNFLGSAQGEKQYFPRATERRSGAGFYYAYLLDCNTFGASAGNFKADENPVTSIYADADVRLNGAKVFPATQDDFSRHANIVSIGFADGDSAEADRLAFNGRGYAGGIQIGELLVYTNSLTSQQRRQINAFLRAKWLKNDYVANDTDLKWIKQSDTSDIKTGANGIAIETLASSGKTLSLDGNLAVERISDAVPSVVFSNNASNLTVTSSPVWDAIPENPVSPAPGSEVWLDANVSVTTFNTNCFGTGVTYVSKWCDCREGGTNEWGYGAVAERTSFWTESENRYVFQNGVKTDIGYTCYPTVSEDGDSGLKMIDFGPQRKDQHSSVFSAPGITTNDANGLELTGVRYIYEFGWDKARDAASMTINYKNASVIARKGSITQFYVVSANESDGESYFITHSSKSAAGNTSASILLDSTCSGEYASAEWYVDGKRIDPTTFPVEKGKTYVIGIRLPSVVSSGLYSFYYLFFYPSGNGMGTWGGMRLGEYISYPRTLTDREYFETEAYLLKKWKGIDHPVVAGAKNAQKFGSVAFADAETPSITACRDVEVGMLSFAGGSFAKTGAGNLAVASAPKEMTSIVVEDGSFSAVQDWLDDAAFHFDASKYESFEWRDGQTGTSIAKWNDIRDNGKYATSEVHPIDNPADCQSGHRGHDSGMTNAQYRVSDGSDGLVSGMGYVDFLELKSKINYANNISILAASNNCAGMKLSAPLTALREFHVVYAYNNADKLGVLPLGATNSDLIPNSANDTIFNSGSTIAREGTKLFDGGDWYEGNYYSPDSGHRLGTSYHVWTHVVPSGIGAAYIAMDRVNCARGGLRVCEIVMFDKTNTLERAETIHAYLRKKWLDAGEAVQTGAFLADVTLKNDATLTLGNDVTLGADSKIYAHLSSSGATCFTVGGCLSVSPGATLVLDIAGDMLSAEGEWTLVSATRTTGGANLRVELADGISVTGTWKTKWENGSLKLSMSKGGLILLMK